MTTNSNKNMKKLIWGVGINDANYTLTYVKDGKRYCCPFYNRWYHILRRCYDKKFHEYNPCYTGCSVVDEWKIFSNFKSWMERQDWEGKELDKDFLFPGNKIYGPDTCIFIPHKINSFLTIGRTKDSDYPLGCSYSKSNKKFISRIEIDNKKVILGKFDDPMEAHRKWQIKKIEAISIVLHDVVDNKLKESLLRISNKIYEDYTHNKETKNFN